MNSHEHLPIGQLSEEAAEATNKHFRLNRSKYVQNSSREHYNMDIINRLLLVWDPFSSPSKQVIKEEEICEDDISEEESVQKYSYEEICWSDLMI
ncbi:hypothetical protein AVEN_216052-1 [Araneus ventricosus]|uniref:Uncharacterized protein n=1 Tax=Araneus ventricosus TaxID=182803 RepID=A0A4Y2MU07_ARAVE|nr:hypothetical protein AVEN_216052-1 [Araneus ventricosus]